ncbi:MAG: Mth938-like domain-containing protein [Candidatus Odinarchaeia archaeon]
MKIESYKFGEIVISGKKYGNDVIVFDKDIIPNWWREEGHSLHIKDLKSVLDYKPEVLIIGTGYNGLMKVNNDTLIELRDNGINVIVEKTKVAVEKFNEYIRKGKKVAAALHLTC